MEGLTVGFVLGEIEEVGEFEGAMVGVLLVLGTMLILGVLDIEGVWEMEGDPLVLGAMLILGVLDIEGATPTTPTELEGDPLGEMEAVGTIPILIDASDKVRNQKLESSSMGASFRFSLKKEASAFEKHRCNTIKDLDRLKILLKDIMSF